MHSEFSPAGPPQLQSGVQVPEAFVTDVVDLAMMRPAQRHRELIAHLASQCPRLSEPQMVGLGQIVFQSLDPLVSALIQLPSQQLGNFFGAKTNQFGSFSQT